MKSKEAGPIENANHTPNAEQALAYHAEPRPGKIEMVPLKPCETQEQLSLAYSPGVAEPVKAIVANPEAAYLYTAKGNLVAVISDGTAVLGLGRTGALASKPVMEGKAVLFKRFANIDVFDIEVQTNSIADFIATVVNISPSFGGINLEDIAAPACFEIEQSLREQLDIPVFHDDQHGTAITVAAALLNALEIQGKQLNTARIVILGAGAAGLATADLLCDLGADIAHIRLLDRGGVIHSGRDELGIYKQPYAVETTDRTLKDALHGADIFIGLSGPGLLTPDWITPMARRPILFALSNPIPEIWPEQALAACPDAIMATGRSDYPNQVNNVLGFPYLFRGALDVRARAINRAMEIAAVEALRRLTHEEVPQDILTTYGLAALHFGPDYILPKPFDPRLLEVVSSAVARAAHESGVARCLPEAN